MRTALLCLAAVATAEAGTATNPFADGNWYVNPSYHALLDTSIAKASGTVKATLESMRDVPSAWWIDVKAKTQGTGTNTVPGILADAAAMPNPPLVTFMVYDVPNRDCHAMASNGEICCTKKPDGRCDYLAQGDCAEGLAEYQREYIDPLVALFAQYQDTVPLALIIEPDSLPNLATNLDDPRCSNPATQNAYKKGITYAVTQFATKVPKAALYLDAAHGGWLGWENNMKTFSDLIKGMGVVPNLRGFATNVANYQPIGTQCPELKYCVNGKNQGDPCCADPCSVSTQWNLGHNEANYVKLLLSHFPDKHVVIDSGRNGVEDMRQDCANWCNARGAGIGRYPTIDTGIPGVDAFYWLKTPGESDGCTQQLPTGGQCPRFDEFCGSQDSLGSGAGEPRAPEAGHWFDYQIKQLAANANMFPNGGSAPPPKPVTPPFVPPPVPVPPFVPPPVPVPPFVPPPVPVPPFVPPPVPVPLPVPQPVPVPPFVPSPVVPPTQWTAAPGGKTPAPGTTCHSYGFCGTSSECCSGSKCFRLMPQMPTAGMCLQGCATWDCTVM